MLSKSKSAKSELRSDLLQQLKNVTDKQQAEWSALIQSKLKYLLSNETGYWGAFQNLQNEPQLNWELVSEKINWCFPQVENESIKFKYQASHFQLSGLGVQEPVNGEIIPAEKLDGVIVPGLAFSEKGHRLGRGKGYYDRQLAQFKGKKIGVCYTLTLVKDLPSESHDVLFHHIVTESSLYHVAHSEGDSKWN